MAGTPQFLIVKAQHGDADRLGTLAAALADGAADVLAAARPDDVEVLEPGSPRMATVIARFPAAADLAAWWDGGGERLTRTAGDGELLAASVAGLPLEGLPGDELPTIASVQAPADVGPRHYMLIEGSVAQPEPMVRYRAVILPMMAELGSYYIVFELGGAVQVLAGAWDKDIFAISRWPTAQHAHEFWFSDRYNEVAVPLREGAGDFRVLLMAGRTD